MSARSKPAGYATELWIGCLLAAILLAGILWTARGGGTDPMYGDLMARFKSPGENGYWLGTDQLGRDLWSRVLAGLSWSTGCALLATTISFLIGTAFGLLAAESSGIVRVVILRLVDLALAFPGLVAAICIMAVVGQGFWPLVLTLSLLSWPVFSRVVYAETLKLLSLDYVRAARMGGSTPGRILLGHVLPGLRGTLLVMFAFHFADLLIAESALSFLGIGAPLGTPTWGNMLAESRQYMFQAPWMLFAPAGAIVIAVICANLVGDGLDSLQRARQLRT
jgi:peptide/nickel transport system permease protein